MASLPVKTILTRALHQLHHLQLPTIFARRRIFLHGAKLPDVSSFLKCTNTRGFHVASIAWAQKSDKGTATRKPTVIDRNQEVQVIMEGVHGGQVMTKAHAEKLANARDLKMVLIDGSTDSEIPTYKFMTGKDLREERERLQELKKANKKREPKVLRITNKISQHDLQTKTKKIVEWLEKGQDVKIHIKISRSENSKVSVDVFKYVTAQTKDMSTVGQAQKSEHEMVYLLKPINSEPPKTIKVKPFANDELKAMNTDSKT